MTSVRFWHVRVAVLLAVLLGVLLYAWRDLERRRVRKEWRRPVRVALVLVGHEPIDREAVRFMQQRVPALEARLDEEAQRYFPESMDAFDFEWFGPVAATRVPPLEAEDDLLGRLDHAWRLWRYARTANEAAGLDSDEYDVCVYLAAYQGRGRMHSVEGVGQEGGHIGVVRIELVEGTVDFALIVAAHETFHTLGATDRYDSAGRTLIPDGLAEPGRRPVFPQRYVEVMARNRPLSESEAVPPESLDELRVGPITAREIGWPVP